MNQKMVVAGGGAFAGTVVGFAVGYFVAKRHFKNTLIFEIQEFEERFKRENKKGEYASATEAASHILPDFTIEPTDAELQRVVEGLRIEYDPSEVVGGVKNVFVDAEQFTTDDEWDKYVEMRHESGRPYIISDDEYFDAPDDYAQLTLTYYEEDHVLATEKEIPVEDPDAYVGNENLRFGWNSNDRNTVFIRNEANKVDFEIVRNRGSYGKLVAGFDDDDDRKVRPRKMRKED